MLDADGDSCSHVKVSLGKNTEPQVAPDGQLHCHQCVNVWVNEMAEKRYVNAVHLPLCLVLQPSFLNFPQSAGLLNRHWKSLQGDYVTVWSEADFFLSLYPPAP